MLKTIPKACLPPVRMALIGSEIVGSALSQGRGFNHALQKDSGTETGWLNQPDLVATGRELAPLVALDDHATSGFDADHPGTHPAKSSRLQHLDNITGLQIQLHLRK